MTKLNRQYFIDRAVRTELKYYKLMDNAPARNGWNRTFGVKIPGVVTLENELNTKLRLINNRCMSHGHAAIYEDAEEKVENPMQRVE